MLEKYEISVKDWQQYRHLAPAANSRQMPRQYGWHDRKEVSWGIYMPKPVFINTVNKSRKRARFCQSILWKIRSYLVSTKRK